MESAIDYIKRNRVTDKFEIIKILMERAERLSPNGAEKKKMVIEAFVNLNNSDSRVEKTYSMIPLNSIELIIDALIFASNTAISINKKTGCFDKVKAWFSKKKAVPVA